MRISLYRSAALCLALVAMLLRAFVPDGWMPNPDSGGTLFTICSIESAVHRDGKAPQGDGRTHAPCAFAAASTLAPPPLMVMAFGVTWADPDLQTAPWQERADSVSHHRPNAARAPPAFA